MYLLLFYIFVTLILIYEAHQIDELDIKVVLWPIRVASYIGFKETININTIIGIGLGIFYIYLYSGNAEELTHFVSEMEKSKDTLFLRAEKGLGMLILFSFIGPYLIAIAPGGWVLIGYNLSFITLLAVFSF